MKPTEAPSSSAEDDQLDVERGHEEQLKSSFLNPVNTNGEGDEGSLQRITIKPDNGGD